MDGTVKADRIMLERVKNKDEGEERGRKKEQEGPSIKTSPSLKETESTQLATSILPAQRPSLIGPSGSLIGAETCYGLIDSVEDAILVVEACRRGLLPRVNRRLGDRDRALIRSGSIFVFVERESGIKRWTDGKIWSPSRISGEFLSYRQLEQRITPFKRPLGQQIRLLGNMVEGGSSFKEPLASDEGENSNGCVSKKDGLVKKTISLRVSNETCHLISYCSDSGFDQTLKNLVPTRHPFFAPFKGSQIFSSVVPVRNTPLKTPSTPAPATPARTPPPILPSRIAASASQHVITTQSSSGNNAPSNHNHNHHARSNSTDKGNNVNVNMNANVIANHNSNNINNINNNAPTMTTTTRPNSFYSSITAHPLESTAVKIPNFYQGLASRPPIPPPSNFQYPPYYAHPRYRPPPTSNGAPSNLPMQYIGHQYQPSHYQHVSLLPFPSMQQTRNPRTSSYSSIPHQPISPNQQPNPYNNNIKLEDGERVSLPPLRTLAARILNRGGGANDENDHYGNINNNGGNNMNMQGMEINDDDFSLLHHFVESINRGPLAAATTTTSAPTVTNRGQCKNQGVFR